jgi:hypothetical protein
MHQRLTGDDALLNEARMVFESCYLALSGNDA